MDVPFPDLVEQLRNADRYDDNDNPKQDAGGDYELSIPPKEDPASGLELAPGARVTSLPLRAGDPATLDARRWAGDAVSAAFMQCEILPSPDFVDRYLPDHEQWHVIQERGGFMPSGEQAPPPVDPSDPGEPEGGGEGEGGRGR